MTLGTRGDVQPYIALALGLRDSGHEVTIATCPNFENFVTGYDIPFRSLRFDIQEFLDSEQGRDLLKGHPYRPAQVLKTLRIIKEKVMPMAKDLLEDTWQLCQDADALIFHPKITGGEHISELGRIPCISASTVPMFTPTSEFAMPGMPFVDLGPVLNKWSYELITLGLMSYRGVMNEFRKNSLGLPPMNLFDTDRKRRWSNIPILYCFSSSLVPVQESSNVHATGYWFLDQHTDWRPSHGLVDFLNSGDSPVYFGFGSMPLPNPEETLDKIIESIRKTGIRAVIATGWSKMESRVSSDRIHFIDSAPHDWLFERVKAVVHHGGAGTTAAGLRAGKPTLICPVAVDQPFWGYMVHKRNVGPKPIPVSHITVSNLTAAIESITTDQKMITKAGALGQKIRDEDGVSKAVEIIEKTCRQ